MKYYIPIFIYLFYYQFSFSQIKTKPIDSTLPYTIIYIYQSQSKGLTESFYYCPKLDSSVQYFYESSRFARQELLVMEKSSQGFKVKFANSPTEYLFKVGEMITPDDWQENIPRKFTRLNPDGSKSNFELYRYFNNHPQDGLPTKTMVYASFSVIYINEKSPVVESITISNTSYIGKRFYYQSKTLKEQELEELRQIDGIIYLKFKDKPTVYAFKKEKGIVTRGVGFEFYGELIRINPDGSRSVFTLQD
jgi:hypothetical protein